MKRICELAVAMLVGCAIMATALKNSGMLLITGRPFDTYRQEFDGHEYVVFRSSTGAICSEHNWQACKKCREEPIAGVWAQPAAEEPPVSAVPLCPDCEKLMKEVKEFQPDVIRFTDKDSA
jgi:hypothetical protein